MPSLFSSPKMPAAPPPPPTVEDPAVKQAAADQAAKLKQRRGRASTILTSPSGTVGGTGTTGGATVLG